VNFKPFYQEKKITTSLVIIAFILWLFWIYSSFIGDIYSFAPLLVPYAIIGILSWILVLMDMFDRKFYHRKYWVLFMVLLQPIAPIIYVFKRHKLQRIEDTVNA